MSALPPRNSSRRQRKLAEASQIDTSAHEQPHFCIIGGGIAGVCCAQELSRLNPTEQIFLVSATDVLREATAIMKLTNNLEEISVFERSTDQFCMDNKNITVIKASVLGIDYENKQLHLNDGRSLQYRQVCICTGSQPKTLFQTNHKNILTIRDMQSVEDLCLRLETARRVVVVGNGGISMELVSALDFCDVTWVIRDPYVGSAFFDATASAFVAPELILRSKKGAEDSKDYVCGNKRSFGEATSVKSEKHVQHLNVTEEEPRKQGSALGPEWIHKSGFKAHVSEAVQARKGSLRIEYEDEVCSVQEPEGEAETHGETHALRVTTFSGKVLECDFCVCAIGVRPNLSFLQDSLIRRDEEGALLVDSRMQTSQSDVYAAGDCCTIEKSRSFSAPNDSTPHHWFQMRLWTQARSMGHYAACCMYENSRNGNALQNNHAFANDIVFEVFAHVTRFFGYKVVLLGRYNAQGLGHAMEARVKELVVTDRGLVDKSKATAVAQGIRGEIAVGAAAGASTDNDSNRDDKTASMSEELEIWVRVTPGAEYVKVVVYRGCVVGALLLGDTDLEECMENLILNRIDVSSIGSELLNPDFDLEDYFD